MCQRWCRRNMSIVDVMSNAVLRNSNPSRYRGGRRAYVKIELDAQDPKYR